MEEIWKDIKSYEGLYQVSSLGRIKRNYRENIDLLGRKRIFKESLIKPNIDKEGYLYVNLYKNHKKKIFKIHRLVANTFITNTNNKPQVNHIDGNKKNNNVYNLEWVTRKENIQHAYKQNLIKSFKVGKDVLYDLYFNKKYTLKEIGRMYGYSDDAVRRVFKQHGFKVARNNARTNITKEWLIRELKAGKTQKIIAQECNISSGYLSELCKKYGLYKNKKPYLCGLKEDYVTKKQVAVYRQATAIESLEVANESHIPRID